MSAPPWGFEHLLTDVGRATLARLEARLATDPIYQGALEAERRLARPRCADCLGVEADGVCRCVMSDRFGAAP